MVAYVALFLKNIVAYLALFLIGLSIVILLREPGIEIPEDKDLRLYEQGFNHGKNGKARQKDGSESYNDGYSDGSKRKIEAESTAHKH